MNNRVKSSATLENRCQNHSHNHRFREGQIIASGVLTVNLTLTHTSGAHSFDRILWILFLPNVQRVESGQVGEVISR